MDQGEEGGMDSGQCAETASLGAPEASSPPAMTPEEGAPLQGGGDCDRPPSQPPPSQPAKVYDFSKCNGCRRDFASPGQYLEHRCEPHRTRSPPTPTKGPKEPAPCDLSDSSQSDVETFTGKIVYNPDGSAYIIEGGGVGIGGGAESELSEEDCSLDLPQQEGSIVDARGMSPPPPYHVFPQVVNAFHICRNPALYGALYLLHEKKVPDIPIMHSYRVFSMREKQTFDSVPSEEGKENVVNSSAGSNRRAAGDKGSSYPPLEHASVPIKPILMCFICKLSFGYTKSFMAHAMGEHNINLNEDERQAMARKNASAIIQGVGKDKEPLLSFLEPVSAPALQPVAPVSGANQLSTNFFAQPSSLSSSLAPSDQVTSLLSAVGSAVASSASRIASTAVTTLVSASSSPVTSVPEIRPRTENSRHNQNIETFAPELEDLANIEKLAKAAAAAAAAEGNGGLLLSGYEGVPCSTATSTPPTCLPNHASGDELTRRSPYLINSAPTTPGSLERPTSAGSSGGSVSPGIRGSPKMLAGNLLPGCHSPTPPNSGGPVYMTGCALHPDGKIPNGVECPKCEMVLGSSRSLGGHMTMMHSRNSCKTLKCPKCNWHYKYQETLEIHMKEKHPENEMNCIYCLTNQPHPRLARGETYTCGYKPYRCEVCNYSTTTKGNLSIHMQSDKHINNVQELQNGTMAAAAAADHLMSSVPQNLPATGGGGMPVDQAKKVGGVPGGPAPKPKATWRCDVCNYETNVARNLRIHMTSEKHTHNMMVLQQNVKHMQQLTAIQQAQAQSLDPLFQFHPGLLLPCDTQLQPEAALADMAYNHALLMMASQQHQQRAIAAAAAAVQQAQSKNVMSSQLALTGCGGPQQPTVDMEHPDPSFRPEAPHDESSKLFQCCICNAYSVDGLECLNQHLQQDRTRQREDEVLMAVAGSYICKLCTYKTNLKANFQLHCKTDKHLQRLQQVNHIKEGGARNDWKLKYLNVSNPVQVRCNACDYYTNSVHKLQLHTANPRHEASAALYLHLQSSESNLPADAARYYHCKMCSFSTRTKINLIHHVHSLRHLRNENIRQLHWKTNSDGGRDSVSGMEEDPRDLFLALEYTGNEKIIFDADVDVQISDHKEAETKASSDETSPQQKNEGETKNGSSSMLKQALLESNATANKCESNGGDPLHQCPFCNYSSGSAVRIQMHVVAQHSQGPTSRLKCPLCPESLSEMARLEAHLTEVHHVNQEGVQKLLLMVDTKDWTPSADKKSPEPNAEDLMETSKDEPMDVDLKSSDIEGKDKIISDDIALEEFCCPVCAQIFFTVDELFTHQNEQSHLELKNTPRGPGYLCWKKGCNQYFKTTQALQIHFREIHTKKPSVAFSDRHVYKYRCNQCSLAFKTLEKLQLHSQYHLIRAATKCVLCGRSFRTVAALQKHVEASHTDMNKDELEQYRASLVNNPLLSAAGGGILDPQMTELLKKESNRDDCEPMDDIENNNSEEVQGGIGGETEEDSPPPSGAGAGDGSYKDQQFLEDFINSQAIAEDTYNDPSRKYKCHRCKVAFTRQSYLTSHNKTLLHRKGEKLSYPMEKYLDPNRPYKCEICKESFTQKNILLVHYNSVSHLHKLKLSMKENGPTNTCNSISPPATTNSNALPPTSTSSTACNNSSSGSGTNSTTSNSGSCGGDADKKPFKCNICKVAYSQGSTLDIHMRSVLHQTRASKLPELAMTGQVDLSTPLIERPEPSSQEQSKSSTPFLDMSAKFMQPNPQVNSPNLELSHVPTNVPVSSASQQTSHHDTLSQSLNLIAHIPQSQSSAMVAAHQQQLSQQNVFTCQRCSAAFVSQDALHQHQQLYCFFSQPPGLSLLGPVHTSSATTTSVTQTQTSAAHQSHLTNLQIVNKEDIQKANELAASLQHAATAGGNQLQTAAQLSQQLLRAKCNFPRCKPPMYKHLLESYGFEIVMQFNENHQRRPRREEKKDDTPKGEDAEGRREEKKPERTIDPKLPEINRSVCNICQKEFSSIWVLKAHKEEIHRDTVPFKFLNKYADEYRQEYDKQNPSQPSDDGAGDNGQQIPGMEQHQQPATSVATSSMSSPALSIPNSSTPPVTSHSSQIVVDVTSVSAANQVAAQLQFNQLLMSMGLGMGLPMGMNMPFAAMNLHPPLLPVMMPPPMDPLMASAFNHPMMSGMDNGFFASQQKLLQQQQQQQLLQAQQQQKRARTRISDDQLKILRTYFDINNSPTEEQLMEMSEKSGLPLKVIKHWFRNTLFKERQRNKDSPYNFNNPPSTFLNLEEYEKTGETKVTTLHPEEPPEISKPETPIPEPVIKTEEIIQPKIEEPKSIEEPIIEPRMEPRKTEEKHDISLPPCSMFSSNSNSSDTFVSEASSSTSILPKVTNSLMTPLNMTDFNLRHPVSEPTSPILVNANSAVSLMHHASITPPTSDSPSMMCNSTPTSSGGTSGGKRANRTRFTDYQIKVLQEFFESNAYPKDDDLEYLSKLLNLSPRVIVVWFQNARQKARKVYENQPPVPSDDEGRFQRTPGLNYQCKKCLQVFQRYYELIKHQKSACFKDENPLAGQIKSSQSAEERTPNPSPVPPRPTTPTLPRPSDPKFGQNGSYRCDKCSLVFPRFDLWREHQIVHIMNPNLFPNYPPNSSFGILQYEAQQSPLSAVKRKMTDEEDSKDSVDPPKDKRLRTTILPEQLDYLYQKYQVESNPSRKMLENIAREVGLKKRVVQVWFQNTRARERKGQFRAHQQVIHKRCPFCRALFKARSALESHLATRHADQYTKGDINIDALPDGDDSNLDSPSNGGPDENKNSPSFLNALPTSQLSVGNVEAIHNSMKRYYEDSLKKYLDELNVPNHPQKENSSSGNPTDLSVNKAPSKTGGPPGGDAPLDLSRPIGKVDVDRNDCLTIMLSEKSYEDCGSRGAISADDGRSETHSDSTDNMDGEEASYESNPPSPGSHHRNYHGSGKRFRTQMTTVQLKVMKTVFHEYKTPSMAECEMLGREIGLPKRVVQVWFQNARAKEKKAKLAFVKTFGQEMETPKPPEECTVCNVKYNMKYSNTSLQDHLFSKRHIETLKTKIESMKKLSDGQDSMDKEDYLNSTSQFMSQSTPTHSQHSPSEPERSRSVSGTNASTPNTNANLMHQLQIMGLHQMAGLPVNMPGFGPGTSPKEEPKENTTKTPPATISDGTPKVIKEELPSPKSKDGSAAQQSPAQAPNSNANASLMNSLGDFNLPTSEAATLFPYMYAGFPGYYAGVPGAFLQPTMYTGSPPGSLFYDSASMYSAPLSLVQLPAAALPEVTQKLSASGNGVARFSQDGKTLTDLRGAVSEADWSQAAEVDTELGFVCKKCQTVFPAEVLCANHQRTSCYSTKAPADIKATLKLVQVHFECRACRERFPTVLDYKFHCDMDRHVKRVQKLQRLSAGADFLHKGGTTPASDMLTELANAECASHLSLPSTGNGSTPTNNTNSQQQTTTKATQDGGAQQYFNSVQTQDFHEATLRLNVVMNKALDPALMENHRINSKTTGRCFADLTPETERI